MALQSPNWPLWIALVVLLFGSAEANLCDNDTCTLTTTIIPALIGSIPLTTTYWRLVIPVALAAVFIDAFVNNWQELRARRQGRATGRGQRGAHSQRLRQP